MSWKGSWGGNNRQGGVQQTPPWKKAAEPAAKAAKITPIAAKTEPAKAGLLPLGKLPAKTQASAASSSSSALTAEELKERVTKITTDLACTETVTKTTLETSTVVLENDKATVTSCKSSLESLERQQKKLNEMQASITKDWAEARKTSPSSQVDLGKLRTKCAELLRTVNTQLAKIKPRVEKLQAEADLKAKEATDTAAFRPILAKLKADVSAVETATNAVSRQATPVIAKPPEEAEALDKKAKSIEEAASEAMKKLEEARKAVAEKTKEIQSYAPEVKKTSQASLIELQKKLTEHFKTINVFKNFKKELPKLALNQKAVTEATEKLHGHETRISKSEQIAKSTKLSKKQIQTIDENLEPVSKAIVEANAIMAKAKGADAVAQAKFEQLRTKSNDFKKKIEELLAKIKDQKQVFDSEDAVTAAEEQLEKLEGNWKSCQEAEMPFLTGVEVLAAEISEKTLKACTESAAAATLTLNAAKLFMKTKLAACKAFEKELAKSTTDSLTEVQTKLSEIEVNLTKYRKELQERKVAAVLDGAQSAVMDFQKATKSAEAAGKVLTSSDIEDETEEVIQEAITKTKEALKEATKHHGEASKQISGKAREAKVANNNPFVVAMLELVSAAQSKTSKLNSATIAAERLLRTKAALALGEEKVKAAEAAVEKAEKAAEVKQFTAESVASLDEACAAAMKTVNVAISVLQPHAASAPVKVKAAIQELLDRNKAAKETVDKVKADTKATRETTLTDHFLAEAEAKTAAAEAAVAKLEEEEAPFLIGATLELQATQELIAKCEASVKAGHAARTALQQYTAQKTTETRPFDPELAKKVKESFAEMTERIKKAAVKLATSEKDLKERTKDMRMVEASAKADEFDAVVQRAVAAAEPFTKEGEKLSESDAEQPLKAFMEISTEVGTKAAQLKSFLTARQTEQRGNVEHSETIKKLMERHAKCLEEVNKVKKATAPYEQVAQAKLDLAQAKEQVAALEKDLITATDACAPLLEEHGEEFLVGNSLRALASALQEHMKDEDLNEEAVFKKVSAGKPADEATFVKYLKGLPNVIGQEELSAFSDERRVAIFKRLAADGKCVKLEDFKSIFRQTYRCAKPVAITDKFAVGDSEVVCKLAAGDELELFGLAKDDESGLTRTECKFGDKTGWVTIKQKQGASWVTFLGQLAMFTQCSARIDKLLADLSLAVQKALNLLSVKMKHGVLNAEGTIKEIREEFAKLKEETLSKQKAHGELKTKASKAKNDFLKKEQAEANAYTEAKNLKEAAPFVEDAKSGMKELEADAQAAADASADMAKLSGQELEAFATPASVLEKLEKLAASVVEKAKATRETIKEKTKAASEVAPQTGGTAEAKKQLKAMSAKLEDLARRTNARLSLIKSKCKAVVDSKLDPAAEGIRKHAQEKKTTPEALFDKLKTGDKIREGAFCKLLESLDGLSLSPEVAKLVCHRLEADGVSKDAFLKFVVLYYKIVKTIAFTDDMDITKCKTLEKGTEGDVIEVLEGPVQDETNGLLRIRGKSIKAGTSGWLTVSGTKGTNFMLKCEKP